MFHRYLLKYLHMTGHDIQAEEGEEVAVRVGKNWPGSNNYWDWLIGTCEFTALFYLLLCVLEMLHIKKKKQ